MPHEICVDVTTKDETMNLHLVARDIGFGYELRQRWTFMGTEFQPTGSSLSHVMFEAALDALFAKIEIEHEPS